MVDSRKLSADEFGGGPTKDRSCTDILCLLLFIAFGVACGVIGVYAFENGNPDLLAQPYDPDHKPCGVNDLKDFPFIYFASPAPESLYRTVCVKECPQEGDKTLQCSPNSVVKSCSEALSPTDSEKRTLVYASVPYGGVVCLPEVDQYMDKISEALNVSEVDNAMKDLRNTWMIITASGFLAIIVGFIFLKLLRFSAGCVVWSSILLFLAGLVLAGLYFFQKFQKYEEAQGLKGQKSLNSQQAIDKQDSKYIKPEDYQYVAYTFWGLAGLFTIIICFLSSRIRLSIAVIKCSARFVEDTKSILLVPIIFFVLTFVYIVYWIVVASNLYSCGEISDKPKSLPFGQFEFNEKLTYFGYTHLFSLFWSTCFLIASCQFIIIGACAFWYYQRGGPSVSDSIGLYLKYHIGTVAFGSLILAIVQVIRVIFEYMAEQARQSGAANNQAVQCLIKCMECFLACFERFIRFLNKNAYINTVMTGNSFCPAAKDAFSLLMRNPARISLVSGFGEFFEFLGNFAIMAATTITCYLIITNTEYYEKRLSSPVVPTVCFAIISYTVGNFFMSLVGTAADCIIILFCMDEEMHTNPMYEPEELRDFRDEHDKQQN